MRKYIVIALPGFLLSACAGGGEEAVETEIEAGRWDVTTEFLELAQVERSDELTAAMGDIQNISQVCIDEKEATAPIGIIFAPEASDIVCTYKNVKFSGGKLSAGASCLLPGVSEPVDMKLDGSYTRTSYQGEWTLTREVDGKEVTSTGSLSGKYTGVC